MMIRMTKWQDDARVKDEWESCVWSSPKLLVVVGENS